MLFDSIPVSKRSLRSTSPPEVFLGEIPGHPMVSEFMHKSPAKLILLSLCFQGLTLVPAFAQSRSPCGWSRGCSDERSHTVDDWRSAQPRHQPTPANVTSYVLGPEDQITVRVFAADDIPDKPVQIDNDGTVTLPMIGQVHAAGLTVGAIAGQPGDRLQEILQGSASHRPGERFPQPTGVCCGQCDHAGRGAVAGKSQPDGSDRPGRRSAGRCR